MSGNFNRDSAWELVKKYNEEPFHLHHAVTVEGVMRYYAENDIICDIVVCKNAHINSTESLKFKRVRRYVQVAER